jgi:hypothetical protein
LGSHILVGDWVNDMSVFSMDEAIELVWFLLSNNSVKVFPFATMIIIRKNTRISQQTTIIE